MASQKKHPRKNIPKTWAYTNQLLFLKELSRLQKLHFPQKTIWTDIFDWVWRKIFCRLLSWCLFSLGQGENTSGKNAAETQSQTYSVADLHLNRQSWHVSQYSEFSHNKQEERFDDIKNRFNRYGGQASSHTTEKNISNVWTVGQFDIGQLRCGNSPVQHFGSSKLSDKQDVGPARRAHVNGRIDMPINAQKSLETIFIQKFLKVENQKWLRFCTKTNMK